MKPIYIGTYLPPDKHREFRVIAAQSGESASSLLKKLVNDFIAKSAKKGGAK